MHESLLTAEITQSVHFIPAYQANLLFGSLWSSSFSGQQVTVLVKSSEKQPNPDGGTKDVSKPCFVVRSLVEMQSEIIALAPFWFASKEKKSCATSSVSVAAVS